MGFQFSIYCHAGCSELTPDQLWEGIRSIDNRAAADQTGVGPEWSEPAVQHLVVEETGGGFGAYRICYTSDRSVPIEVIRWHSRDPSIHNAMLADIAEGGHPSFRRIAAHLRQPHDLIEISFGSNWREAMAPILARSAATCFAAWFSGIVKAPDGSWWEVNQRTGYQPLSPDSVGPPTIKSVKQTLGYARGETAKVPRPTWNNQFPLGNTGAAPTETFLHNRRPPIDCPSCGIKLYPDVRLRPRPISTGKSKLITAIAVALTLFLYLGSALLIRACIFIPGLILFPVLLPMILPGIWIGIIAHRIPKTIDLKCWQCGWADRFFYKSR